LGGAIGVAYGFCFLRVPKLLPLLVAVHVVLALVLTPHLGSLAVDWAQVASTAAGVDVSVHISGFEWQLAGDRSFAALIRSSRTKSIAGLNQNDQTTTLQWPAFVR